MGGTEPEQEPPANVREWLARAARDPSLLPVLITVFLTFATFGAALLYLALRGRNLFATAALAIVVVVSGREVGSAWLQGRRGFAAVVVALWVVAATGAVLAARFMPDA